MKLTLGFVCTSLAALTSPQTLTAQPGPGDTVRVSLNSADVEGNERSNLPAISADGRFVAFESWATNLVPGDSNSLKDIFVRDRVSGTTTRVSIATGGGQGNHNSTQPAISADGRFVAFVSQASNLVSGDSNGFEDVFLHDRNTGSTTRVSVGTGGQQSNGHSIQCALAPDGSALAFSSGASNLVASDTNNSYDVFVRDLVGGGNARVSISGAGFEGDSSSWRPAFSHDGTTVVFDSNATNLVPADTNGQPDVFVHDRTSGATTRVSLSTSGVQGNSYSQEAAISGDGRFVAFESRATTLVSGDLNGTDDVFLHDRLTGETTLVSVHSSGAHGNFFSNRPTISGDGQRIAFQSWSDNLISADGNFDNDIFVHEVATRTTRRVSVDSAGAEGDNHSLEATICANGDFIAFMSDATNLVPGDTNGWGDILVHEYEPETLVGVPYCFGDGSGTACPCANSGALEEGCANSTAAGGLLAAGGTTSAAADDLSFAGSQLTPGQPALLFVGDDTVGGGNGAVFGDGLRCVGGFNVRLTVAVPDASGNAAWGPGLSAAGGWGAGDTRYFQVWYRDPAGGPCGAGFNLTHGLRVIFTP